MTTWDTRRTAKAERVQTGNAYSIGKVIDDSVHGLTAVVMVATAALLLMS